MSDPNINHNNGNPPPKKSGSSIALIVGGLVVAVIVLYWLFAGSDPVDEAGVVTDETNINLEAEDPVEPIEETGTAVVEEVEDVGTAVEAEIDETEAVIENETIEEAPSDSVDVIEVEGDAEVVE